MKSGRPSMATDPWPKFIHLLGTMSDAKLAVLVGVNRNSVNMKRRRLGIKAYRYRKRHPMIPKRLLRLLGKVPDSEIAAKMKRSRILVWQWRNELKIPPYKRISLLRRA